MPGYLTSKTRVPGVPATAGMGDVRVSGDYVCAEPFDNRNPTKSGYDRQHGPTLEAGNSVMDVVGDSGPIKNPPSDVPSLLDLYDTRHPTNGRFAKSAKRSIEAQLHTTREND